MSARVNFLQHVPLSLKSAFLLTFHVFESYIKSLIKREPPTPIPPENIFEQW